MASPLNKPSPGARHRGCPSITAAKDCLLACVPQLNARMVMRIWSLTCENTPDSGISRV
jgi:hypothetical protein